MRIESRKQQEKTEKWKEYAEVQEDRQRKMSVSYETSQKNFKMLNEDMVKLDRKFKYAGLRASLGLPQLEPTTRAKDARHLEEIEELRAIARNEHESLETMIQTLEQQLQQQKDRTDKFIADWQIRKDEWKHACQKIRTSKDQWEAENQNRRFYIRFLADRFREAAQEAQEMVDKAERLIGMTSPFESHRA